MNKEQFLQKITSNKKKLIFGVGLIILIGGYFIYHSATQIPSVTSYLTVKAQKSTIVASVSGSGQVSTLDSVDLKPLVSGQVMKVYVKEGDIVKANQLLLILDDQTAQKAVRDAKANLVSAQLAMQKLQQPVDQLSLVQAQNSLDQSIQSKLYAEDNLVKMYDSGYNEVANTFLDLPSVMQGIDSMLFGTDLSTNGQWNIDVYNNAALPYDSASQQYRDDAYNSYVKAAKLYDDNFTAYKVSNRFSSTSTVVSLINETYNTTKSVADAIKSIINFIQFYKGTLTAHRLRTVSLADTHLASLSNYTSQTNGHLTNLLTDQTSIKTDNDNIVNADTTIVEKTLSLADLKAGTNALDIQSQQLALQQKQNSLLDAEQTMANYYIRAPFDGQIATLAVQKGDSAGSASVITLITQQKIANVSLNEVDVSKVKAGQNVTLTFDAIPDLTVAGVVSKIDAIGTVSQGVVNYNIQINFQTQDERIKSGMSVSAAIITNVKQDILAIPSSAVKTQGSQSYVQVLESVQLSPITTGSLQVVSKTTPRQQIVTTGLSNDTMTEITSGLNEGDIVVTQTITSGTTKTTTAQQSSTGIRIPGITGGGGGFRPGN